MPAPRPQTSPRQRASRSLVPLTLSLIGVIIAGGYAGQFLREMASPAKLPAIDASTLPDVRTRSALPTDQAAGLWRWIRLRQAGLATEAGPIESAGRQGEFLLYSPRGHNSDRPYPLIVIVANQPIESAAAGWAEQADRYRQLIAVAPMPSESPGQCSDCDLGGGDLPAMGLQRARAAAVFEQVRGDWRVEPHAAVARLLRQPLWTSGPDGLDASEVLLPLESAGPSEPSVAGKENSGLRLASWWDRQLQAASPARIEVLPPGPQAAPADLVVRASVSGRAGAIRGYAWDFGTLGQGADFRKFDVTVAVPGDYPIRLTVTTAKGVYHAETVVKVISPADRP